MIYIYMSVTAVTAYLCTTFDDFKYSHSGDMIGAPKFSKLVGV